MKNTLRSLSAVFMILLFACSTANEQNLPLAVDVTPIPLITKTPTKTVSAVSPTTTQRLPTPTEDVSQLLPKLLPHCSDTELSPSQNWATGFCNNDETWIVSMEQSRKWVISYGEYYGSKFDSGGGIIAPFYWTSDNKYLYLTIQREGSGPNYFGNGWGLISLDLTNGNISEILSPIQHQYYSFSLSPDEIYLAYILQPAKSLTVNVLNLKTKDVKSHSLMPASNQAGEILWAPDMSKIVLGQATIDKQEILPDSFSVIVINLADDSRQTLVSKNPVQLTPGTWIDENALELSDTNGKVWVYNFIDKTLIEKAK